MTKNKTTITSRAPDETYNGPAECQVCPREGAACETCKVLADFDAAASNPQSATRNPRLDPGPLSPKAAAAGRACRLLLEYNDLDPTRTGDPLEMSRRIVLLADAIWAAREAMTGEIHHCGLYEAAAVRPRPHRRAAGRAGYGLSLAECAGDGHIECVSCVHHICRAEPLRLVSPTPNGKDFHGHGSNQQ